MKQIDVRFSAADMAEIKGMIGRKLVKYKCDPFEFSTSVYGIVGVAFEDMSFAFTNMVTAMDYYGEQEDVALFKMERTPFSNIQSLVQNQTMVETPVESIVAEVLVVNEQQQLFERGVKTYEVLVTRGIIFKFEDGHEVEVTITSREPITSYELLPQSARSQVVDASPGGLTLRLARADGFISALDGQALDLN